MKYKIAIPTVNDYLCQHFGHCEKFAIIDIEDDQVRQESFLTPPPHEPGVLPGWLASLGVTHVIAGGMGQRAISLFEGQNIRVITGAQEKTAAALAEEFVGGKLAPGVNACDH